MKTIAPGIFLVCALWPHFATAQSSAEPDFIFSGEPVFEEGTVPCDVPYYSEGSVCRKLLQSFAYMRGGMGWEASKGLITDGASIPDWAHGLIGTPDTPEYVKAATLHDHYCRPENHVRDYRETHRMFYHALVDSGLNPMHAGIMYGAVLIGGPKWSTKVLGEDCEKIDGPICVKTSDEVPPDGEGSVDFVGAKYDELPMEDILLMLQNAIEAGNLSPDDIERLAVLERLKYGYSLPSLRLVVEE